MLNFKIFNKFNKIRKKMIVTFSICFFFTLNLAELEKKLFLYNAYVQSKNPDIAVPYCSDIQQAEAYLFSFVQFLFSINYDSFFIKQLLLWFSEQDDWVQSLFLGCLLDCCLNYWWFEDESFIMSLFYLNFYRLGFTDAFYFRLLIRSYCLSGQLTLNNEQQFHQFLVNLVSKYKQYFSCDANDETIFAELLNYKWSEYQLIDTKFGNQ